MAAVFAIMPGFIQWYPFFTGLGLQQFWLKVQFRGMFLWVNLTFFSQNFLGLAFGILITQMRMCVEMYFLHWGRLN